MLDVQQPWVHPAPTTSVRQPRGFHLSNSMFLSALFVSLLIIAIPTLILLPKLTQREQAPNQLVIPELLSNCMFFYQRCPTTKYGVATNQSVDELLSELQSPLLQAGNQIYSRTDRPDSITLTPGQTITYIASEYNINPFLILTLSEMQQQTVTKADKINIQFEGSGAQNAWFAIQHQQMAKDLQQLANQGGLAPNSQEEKLTFQTISIGNAQEKVNSDSSIASGVVAQYLAKQSNGKADLEQKMELFLTTYEKLFGLNPADPNLSTQ